MTNTHEATPGTVPEGTTRVGYQVFVGRSIAIGAVGRNPSPVWYAYLRFPHGYHGRPAMVSYPEIHLSKGV